ncbi:hypothetical protein VQL36_02855 [Chengkuizengella sp. SCS-71B]|uniref:hypothetical protein n=1 Tax=Chengkuizengella sp. SCS-71B TaxID=3115290 RepID=UPI0032C2256E
MGLKKGPFVVADTVSVDDPYSEAAGAIKLPFGVPPVPIVINTVDVCIKQTEKTQVSLNSMTQIAVLASTDIGGPVTFEVIYEIQRNGEVIATIHDKMDYFSPFFGGRITNFPNFPTVDNNPNKGMNTYELRCTRATIDEISVAEIFVASRSLKATVSLQQIW